MSKPVVPAKKYLLCLKCTVPQPKTRKGSLCVNCRTDNVFTFDSKGEGERYAYLKYRSNIKHLTLQPHFKLYAPGIDFTESWQAKTPRPEPNKSCDWVVASTYTADFQYFDLNNPKGWVVDDYKAYSASEGKPVITERTQLKLNWLHAQCSHVFDIIVSYDVPKELGYQIKTIKPTKKD